MSGLIDQLRAVPEFAVRIVMGAVVKRKDGQVTVTFQGDTLPCSQEILEHAVAVAKILSIDTSAVETVNDVLKLRHKAEDLFVERITLGEKGLPKVLFVPAGDMASAFYRARIPASIVTEQGDALAHFTDRLDIGKAVNYNVLWVQLASSPILQSIVRKAKEAGVKIVYDVDDRFDAIPPENPAAHIYVDQKRAAVWTMIGLSDLVTVSTEALAEHIRRRHPNVKVVRNEVSAAIWPRANARPKDHFRILWAGSHTHKRDLDVMGPALCRVLERHAGKVRFTCFGDLPPEALQPVAQYVDRIPFVDFLEYGESLANVGAHLGIAPLEDNEFNSSKSAVKFLEYSSCAYASLLSPVGEYKALPADAPKIMVGADGWEKALEYAISSPEEMIRMGLAAKDWTIKNRCIIKSGAKAWREVIHELVSVPANQ